MTGIGCDFLNLVAKTVDYSYNIVMFALFCKTEWRILAIIFNYILIKRPFLRKFQTEEGYLNNMSSSTPPVLEKKTSQSVILIKKIVS